MCRASPYDTFFILKQLTSVSKMYILFAYNNIVNVGGALF